MKSEDSGTRASTPTITEEQGWNAKDSDGLLKSEKNIERHDGENSQLFQRRISVKHHLVIFSFYILTLLGMGVLLGRSWTSAKKPYLYCELINFLFNLPFSNAKLLLAPANDAVEYYIGEFTDGNDPHGKYVGPPRPSLEKAWQDLLSRK